MASRGSVSRPLFVIIVLLAASGAVWAGFRWWKNASAPPSNWTPAPQAQVQFLEPTNQADYDAIAQPGTLVAVSKESTWSLPIGAQPQQFRFAYDEGDGRLFGLIEQPNSWTPILDDDGQQMQNVALAGVVFSRDSGETWRLAFDEPRMSSPEGYPDRFNPVGMFTANGKIYLDIADDFGAGSGEGRLIRFSTTDASSWHREGCYYFVPERYYVLPAEGVAYQAQLLPITPNKLTAIACPDYAE